MPDEIDDAVHLALDHTTQAQEVVAAQIADEGVAEVDATDEVVQRADDLSQLTRDAAERQRDADPSDPRSGGTDPSRS